MKVGLIGVGRMGENLALNMAETGNTVVLYNRTSEKLEKFSDMEGFQISESIEDLVNKLPDRKIIWMMITTEAIDSILNELENLLGTGDIIIDGGNSHYKVTIDRYKRMKRLGIYYLDVGISGGVKGAREGTNLVVGGDQAAVSAVEPLFVDISSEGGYGYFGASGSGHYLKMVHNGIEYGMMQAIGEGLEMVKCSDYNFELEKVTEIWGSGATISGRLMKDAHEALLKDKNLESIEGKIDTTGEAGWTLLESIEKKVSIPVISAALFARFKSKSTGNFSEKVVASIRKESGGHKVYIKKADPD